MKTAKSINWIAWVSAIAAVGFVSASALQGHAASPGAAKTQGLKPAQELTVGEPAPLFAGKAYDGSDFSLSSRKGKWTVLYFYPKSGTPGCTKQACAFRDQISQIHKLGAEVVGVSADTVEDQAKFHQEHHLNFPLIADPDDRIIELYGTRKPVLKMSKRWTFVLDPALRIRAIEKDVDPVLDADRMAKKIAELQASDRAT